MQGLAGLSELRPRRFRDRSYLQELAPTPWQELDWPLVCLPVEYHSITTLRVEHDFIQPDCIEYGLISVFSVEHEFISPDSIEHGLILIFCDEHECSRVQSVQERWSTSK